MEVRMPINGEEWRHFKGTVYTIVCTTWDAEGDELTRRVVYSRAGGRWFSRGIQNFLLREDGSARFVYISG